MTTYFLDTNALVKAYIFEAGSPWIHGVMAGKAPAPRVCISEIAQVELPSALYKIERIRGYSRAFTDTAINTFARDLRLSDPSRRLRVYDVTALSDAIFTRAETLLEKYRSGKPYGLRSLDSIQLASAQFARASLPLRDRTDFMFVSADRQLLGVAGVEGISTVNPEHP